MKRRTFALWHGNDKDGILSTGVKEREGQPPPSSSSSLPNHEKKTIDQNKLSPKN